MQQNNMHSRKPKNRKGRLVGIFVLLFCIIAAAGAVIQKGNSFLPDVTSKEESHNRVGNESETMQEEKPSHPETEDWMLTLVNKWNPIQDSDQIELTTLSNGKQVDTRIYPVLQEMFDDMREDGVYPTVASGYRTEEEQQAIYDEKYAAYKADGFSDQGAKENTERWVAISGTSEHQLGLGVDINADGIQSAGYQVYDWLEENAHQYGFIYRYPAEKEKITGVKNERWHYRYVGQKAAKEIYEQGICLEEYLEKKY